MPETQRQPVPRNDADELDTALAFLKFARSCVIKKLDGLDDEQVRRVLVGSGTNLLGLIQHLAVSERFWFGYHVNGIAPETRSDFGMDVSVDRTTAEVLADYREACNESDAIIGSAGGLTTLTQQTIDGEHLTLRWVLAHMTSETARHAGHADILREQIDDTTGR